MKIKKIISNRNRIKIYYFDKRAKWYAEMTYKDMKKGLGWFQWGAPEEYLWESMPTTEKLVNEWLSERY